MQLKKILSIGLLLIFLFYPLLAIFAENPDSASASAPAALIISEIGAYEISDAEWIEIFNNSGAALDITAFKFFENNTNHGLTAVQGDFSLDTNEYAIIANKADIFLTKNSSYTGTLFDSSWSGLNESGEETGLKNSSGNLMEIFTYPASESKTSLQRISASTSGNDITNWKPHATLNSIGKENEFGAAAPETPVVTVPEPNEQPTTPPNMEAPPEETQTPTEPVTETPTENTPAESCACACDSSATATSTNDTAQPSTENNNSPTEAATESAGDNNSASPSESATPTETNSGTSTSGGGGGGNGGGSAQSTYINKPPIAIIQVQSGELIAQEKTTINFDGTASNDPNEDKLTYAWDMGDGTTQNSKNPRPHKYDKPGTYTIKLTVTDPSGAKNIAQKKVLVYAKEQSVEFAAAKKTSTESTAKLAAATITTKSVAKKTAVIKATKITKKTASVTANALPETLFGMRGYFVFVPFESSEQMEQKISAQTIATTAAKTAAKNVAKTATAKTNKQIYANGDKSNSIKITEILPNPSAESATDEWIEIYNSGSTSINLGNWGLMDNSKKASPFRIPDDITIKPKTYKIFEKTETAIALNNDKDNVFLTDFEGNIIDTISYEKSKKGESYALLNITNSNNLVASLNPMPDRISNEWEWTPEITPGLPNPELTKIAGTISEISPDENSLTLSDESGSNKKILYSEDIIDPLLAQVVFSKGSQITVRAKKEENGEYSLSKINDVKPAMPSQSQKSSKWLWIFVGAAIICTAMASPILITLTKKYYKKFIKTKHLKIFGQNKNAPPTQ